MSLSPSNGVSRTKTNLTVASLINCSTVPRNSLIGSDKLVKSDESLANTNSKVVSTSTTTFITRSLPTVTNSDLLYKSVSSPTNSSIPPPLAPTCPVTATLTVNYTLQHYANLVGNYRTSGSDNPLSHIKTLTNVVTNPLNKIDVAQYQSKKSYVEIRPAPSTVTNNVYNPLQKSIPLTTKSSLVSLLTSDRIHPASSVSTANMAAKTLLNAHTVVSGVNNKTNFKLTTTPSNTAVPTNHVKNNTVVTSNSLNNRSIISRKVNGPATLPAIFVPRGWNRISEKDCITYISPNKSRLRSMEDLLHYLQLEGTCKCGLECPFKPSEVFNFNSKVPSKFGFSANGKADPNRDISCLVCRKFETMFPPAQKARQNPRGRKPGGKNKRSSSCDESKPSPERKKILLTGASPLEMFQTKMDVINASSSQFALNFQKIPPQQKNNTLYPTNSSITALKTNNSAEKISDNLIVSQPQTTSFSSNATMSLASSNVKMSLAASNATISLPASNATMSLAASNATMSLAASNATMSLAASNATMSLAASNATMSMPAVSFVSTMPAGKLPVGAVISIGGSITGKNMIMSKANKLSTEQLLNNADMLPNKKKQRTSARGRSRGRGRGNAYISPIDSIHKKAIKKVIPDAAVHNARDIHLKDFLNQVTHDETSTTKHILISQLQGLLAGSTSTRTTQELNEISKVLSSLHTLQPLSTSAVITATGSQPSEVIPPPNRTISSVNQLPEGLKNQLSCSTSLQPTLFTSPVPIQSPTLSSSSNHLLGKGVEGTLNMLSGTQKVVVPAGIAPVVSQQSVIISAPLASAKQQQVNSPLHNLAMSQQTLNLPKKHVVNTTGAQQMLLLQLVSQGNTAKPTHTNTPVVCAISVAHPQAYVQAQQPKILFMDNKTNNTSPLQTLAVQKNSQTELLTAISPDSSNRTVQIQGLVQPQISPRGIPQCVAHAVPVQYVSTVNRPGFTIQRPAMENTFPMVQYISRTHPGTVSYVYPTMNKNSVIRPPVSSVPTSFVRIAPAIQTTTTTTVNPLQQEQQKQEQELLFSMQEHLIERKKDISTKKMYDCLPGASEFLTGVAVKKKTPTSENQTFKYPNTSLTTIAVASVTEVSTKAQSDILPMNTSISSLPHSLKSTTNITTPSVDTEILQSLKCVVSKISTPVTSDENNIVKEHIVEESITEEVESLNNKISEETKEEEEENSDELFLHCDETSSALMPDSDEMTALENPSSSNNIHISQLNTTTKMYDDTINSRIYRTGDLVWMQLPNYPVWPGKVISHNTSNKTELEDGHIYVCMFHTKQVHTVSYSQIKPFDGPCNEILKDYRGIQPNDLQKAIYEANQEMAALKTEG